VRQTVPTTTVREAAAAVTRTVAAPSVLSDPLAHPGTGSSQHGQTAEDVADLGRVLQDRRHAHIHRHAVAVCGRAGQSLADRSGGARKTAAAEALTKEGADRARSRRAVQDRSHMPSGARASAPGESASIEQGPPRARTVRIDETKRRWVEAVRRYRR